jgi:hypothetical protein
MPKVADGPGMQAATAWLKKRGIPFRRPDHWMLKIGLERCRARQLLGDTPDSCEGHRPAASAPSDAVDWTSTIHRPAGAYGLARNSAGDRSGPQNDTRPDDAPGRIGDILAVYDGARLICAGGKHPDAQHCSQPDRELHRHLPLRTSEGATDRAPSQCPESTSALVQ